MATAKSVSPAPENQLLAALSPADYRRLLPRLEPIDLPFGKVLYAPHSAIDAVYFLSRGLVSTVAVMANRRTIEIGICGREGAVGAGVILGDATSPFQVIVQVGGSGVRVKIDDFRKVARPGGSLHEGLARYHAAFLIQTAQFVACNGLHTVEQRCCRWLLMTQDRMCSESFGLTHEFLATMLAVRRASVSEVLKPLQARRLIKYERGHVTILNRAKLMAASCECYDFVRGEFERLMG